MSVKPNMITTSKGLVGYAPDRRQCYFNNERSLQFFKLYTQGNCKIECIANFTLSEILEFSGSSHELKMFIHLDKCECVKVSMPREAKTRICNQSEVTCCQAAEDGLLDELLQRLASGSGINELEKTVCNCLPSCTSIEYDAEISQADYDFVQVFNSYMARTSMMSYLARLSLG